MRGRRKITKSIIFLCVLLAYALLINAIVPAGESKAKLSEIFLAWPVLAQQATTFPSDEAGISAYVTVGQTIDLAKAKTSMRGIQAESDNYIIGIMELPGLPEEEFPHMYISSDGWILVYYSKFAPASRIMHWGKYSGGSIITTTLQDAIANICPSIGISAAQAGNVSYYHFNYPDATNMTVAVDTTEEKEDILSYSIPSSVTLYEASFAHYSRGGYSFIKDEDNHTISTTDEDASYLDCRYLEGSYLLPDKAHVMEMHPYRADWEGVAVVFIYR